MVEIDEEKEYWIKRWTSSYPFKFPIELWEDGKCKRCGEEIKSSGHMCKDITRYLKETHEQKPKEESLQGES